MGRWTKALDVAMPRLCPAMALRQLLEQRLRHSTRAASAASVPAPAPQQPTATALAEARTSVGSVR